MNYLFDLYNGRANLNSAHLRFCHENWREKTVRKLAQNWREIWCENRRRNWCENRRKNRPSKTPVWAPKRPKKILDVLGTNIRQLLNFLMALELKLEWREAVSEKLGGASPPDFSDTASSHSNFNSNSIKKI